MPRSRSWRPCVIDRTGEGSYLDLALADAAMGFIAPRGGPTLTTVDADRHGVYPTNDVYAGADGELIAVSAVEQKFWERLRDAMTDCAPGLADPVFDDPDNRHRQHGDRLAALLTAAFSQRRADEWVAILDRLDVCAERVVSLVQAARGEQAGVRGVVQENGGQRQVVFPVLRNGTVMGHFDTVAPELGQHTADVFGAR